MRRYSRTANKKAIRSELNRRPTTQRLLLERDDEEELFRLMAAILASLSRRLMYLNVFCLFRSGQQGQQQSLEDNNVLARRKAFVCILNGHQREGHK